MHILGYKLKLIRRGKKLISKEGGGGHNICPLKKVKEGWSVNVEKIEVRKGGIFTKSQQNTCWFTYEINIM